MFLGDLRALPARRDNAVLGTGRSRTGTGRNGPGAPLVWTGAHASPSRKGRAVMGTRQLSRASRLVDR